MKEFNLSHAVSVFASFTGAAQAMWGLYAVACFSAAGFGASSGDAFKPMAAVILAIGYIAFAVAHMRILLHNVAVRETLAQEILARLRSEAQSLTDYPRSVAAAASIASGRNFTYALHAVVDPCVIALILTRGFGII